jgi:uncharacterized protein (TIGR02001 family)
MRNTQAGTSRRGQDRGARLLVSLLLGVLGAATGSAADPAAETAPGVSVSVTPSFVSQYMFRGIHIGGPSFQTSVEADVGNLFAGVWASLPVADTPSGNGTDEIDPYASYEITLNGSTSLLPGIQAYYYPRADTRGGSCRATLEPNLGLNYSAGALTLLPRICYDLVLDSETYEFNARYVVELSPLHTELDFAATLGTENVHRSVNTAASGLPQAESRNSYWLAGLTVPVAFVHVGKLTVGYAYTMGFSGSIRGDGMARTPDPSSMGRPVLSVIYNYWF